MGRRYCPGRGSMTCRSSDLCAADNPNGADSHKIAGAVGQLLLLADQFYQSSAISYLYLPWRAHLGIAVAARVDRLVCSLPPWVCLASWPTGNKRANKIMVFRACIWQYVTRALSSHA